MKSIQVKIGISCCIHSTAFHFFKWFVRIFHLMWTTMLKWSVTAAYALYTHTHTGALSACWCFVHGTNFEADIQGYKKYCEPNCVSFSHNKINWSYRFIFGSKVFCHKLLFMFPFKCLCALCVHCTFGHTYQYHFPLVIWFSVNETNFSILS